MYRPEKIEKKWQKRWEKKNIYAAEDFSKKPKSYVLIEFPYPSGERLHVGHARSYCSLDSVARLRRMKGFNVLFPFGWDAFGLPAENYAIRTGIHPSITVSENIKNSKEQAISWGLSFDWNREINTTDTEYYRWTQWIFLQLYKAGLAYRDEIPVNWCPSCKINLANEEVIQGKCERCGHETQRRLQKQWMLKITQYADRLLDDLEDVNYRDDIKQQQVNWIGRKEGINVTFDIEGIDEKITAFTTRPDTFFGAAFVAVAPEHSLLEHVQDKKFKKKVDGYVEEALKKSELERISEVRNKTGEFTGLYAINKLNGKSLPIYVSDFVIPSVGTGLVVGVPGHDVRDFEFAQEFDLEVIRVVNPSKGGFGRIETVGDVYVGDEGTMTNSGFLDGKKVDEAIEEMMDYMEKEGFGERTVSYHLRDWVFSRQHYWGEPIPIIYCEKCGEVPVPDEDLPVELPHVEKFQPTDTGESPLSEVKDWVEVKCPKCQGEGRRETDTMPNWAGSSWYFLRYVDPKNDKEFANLDKIKYWMPVDWYNGGMEHTTLHLLYSRFWHKFLYDRGFVSTPEPYAKRTSHGVVYGPDRKRMSKSRGNVVNPDEIIEAFGADSFRMYMMFIGPFEQNVVWNSDAVMGVKRFLNKVWDLSIEVINSKRTESSREVLGSVYRLVEKIEKDLEDLKFNTAVSSYMKTLNFLYSVKSDVGVDAIKLYIRALAVCAPHITEELWSKLGEKGSVHSVSWPKVDKDLAKTESVRIVIQVNGKLRGTVDIERAKIDDEEYILDRAVSAVNMRDNVSVSADDKYIYAKGKVINFIQNNTYAVNMRE